MIIMVISSFGKTPLSAPELENLLEFPLSVLKGGEDLHGILVHDCVSSSHRDVYSMMIQNGSSALLGVGSTKIQSDSMGRLLYEMPACIRSLLLVSRVLTIGICRIKNNN